MTIINEISLESNKNIRLNFEGGNHVIISNTEYTDFWTIGITF